MVSPPILFLKLVASLALRPRHYRRTLAHLNYAFFSGWRFDRLSPVGQTDGGLRRRHYRSYDDYLRQQVSKLPIVHDGLQRQYAERRANFEESFAHHLAGRPAQSVLCLGARDGVEVDALRRLGHLAVGVDIAYPDKNRFVHFGDFHDLPYPDDCFDYVYTNAFDHTFDQEKVLAEIARVIKPESGRFILDVPKGAGKIDAFESFGWDDHQHLVDLISAAGGAIAETRRRNVDDDYYQLLIRFENKTE